MEGFFALSGFLITRSGERLSSGRFLWHRLLRIMPAYWVCLLVIAVIFAPIVWHASHGLTEYPTSTPNPIGFVLNDFLLSNNQQQIGDTLASNPYPTLWNGPIYTLPYEFACYLIILALAAMRVLNRRVVTALLAAAWIWQQIVLSDVLGVTDPRPRRPSQSASFSDPSSTCGGMSCSSAGCRGGCSAAASWSPA